MPLTAPKRPHQRAAPWGGSAPRHVPCPSARPQPSATRVWGEPWPEGRERGDKVIRLLWLRPQCRCASDASSSPPLLRAEVAACHPASPDTGLAPARSPLGQTGHSTCTRSPKALRGQQGVWPETPGHVSPSLKEKGSPVLCRPPRRRPAPGQEASRYPGSPGGDLIRIKWKHLESHMTDKVCTTCLRRGSFMPEISCVMK